VKEPAALATITSQQAGIILRVLEQRIMSSLSAIDNSKRPCTIQSKTVKKRSFPLVWLFKTNLMNLKIESTLNKQMKLGILLAFILLEIRRVSLAKLPLNPIFKVSKVYKPQSPKVQHQLELQMKPFLSFQTKLKMNFSIRKISIMEGL
jgi:hypothetical protein